MATTLLRSSLAWLSYPGVVLGSAVVMISWISRGGSYWQVGPVLVATSAGIAILLERHLTFCRAWRKDRGDLKTDLIHNAVSLGISHVSILLYAGLLALVPSPSRVWPTETPFWIQAIAVIAVMDLSLYLVHRASHVYQPLWKLHAIHHSAERLYWLNGERRHPLHEVLEGLPGLALCWSLGAPGAAVSVYLGLVAIHLMFQHGNIDYKGGPLRYVFAVAELHRWHHQRKWQDVQGNYGAVLSVWDYLFGTALKKSGQASTDVGMDDEPDLPKAYAPQLIWPFRQLIRTARHRS